MPEGLLRKVGIDHFVPVDDGLDGVKLDEYVTCKTMRQHNVKFRRKWFALLRLAFDAWDIPTEASYEIAKYSHYGVPQKNFERFRKDITIAVGFYDMVVNVKGEVRAEAQSIAFGKMEEEEFEELYSKTIDYLLQKILTNYTRADIDRVVDEILGFV